jgi:hypothetical protein
MTDLSLPPATIVALRSKHLAYLAENLTNDRARQDFTLSLTKFYEHLLGLPVKKVVDPSSIVLGIVAVLEADTVRHHFAPIAMEIHRRVVLALAKEEGKLGDYVPPAAREAIDAALARPDLLPEELVRRVLEDEATDDVMRDVLYDALVEFNESVNPFFADWGLPGLLKRFMPIGSGTVLKSLGAVRAEFDKRLEPEIRKFLLAFTRKSKKKTADVLVAAAGDPKFVALRKSIALWAYDETLKATAARMDDDARKNVDRAVLEIVLDVLSKERPRARLVSELEALVATHGEGTVATYLASIGVTKHPDMEKVAEHVWPYVRLVLESPPARAFYERITWDFYATIAASSSEGADGTT